MPGIHIWQWAAYHTSSINIWTTSLLTTDVKTWKLMSYKKPPYSTKSHGKEEPHYMGHPLVNRIGDQMIGGRCSDDEGCQTPDRIYGNSQDADYSAWGSIASAFLNISNVLICHGWSITLWWRCGNSTAGLVVPWGTCWSCAPEAIPTGTPKEVVGPEKASQAPSEWITVNKRGLTQLSICPNLKQHLWRRSSSSSRRGSTNHNKSNTNGSSYNSESIKNRYSVQVSSNNKGSDDDWSLYVVRGNASTSIFLIEKRYGRGGECN